jgi:hypothetical protein
MAQFNLSSRRALFIAVWLWSLGVTWFLQLYLLRGPLVDWSVGEGMLVGHDITNFHAIAKIKAAEIASDGWRAWELQPQGWGVSGLLSAWYAITAPYLWLWAPIQSAVFASSALLMRELVSRVVNQDDITNLAVGLVLMLPGAALLYVYPHRDSFVFFGFLLLLYGAVLFFELQTYRVGQAILLALAGLGLMVIGFAFAISVRHVAAGIFIVLTVLISLIFLVNSAVHPHRMRLLGIMGFGIALLAMQMLTSAGPVTTPEFRAEAEWNSAPDLPYVTEIETPEAGWRKSRWLPTEIDRQFENLAAARARVIRIDGHGRSAVDLDVQYNSVIDMISYLPRAAQIGFLAPFPSDWQPHPQALPHRNLERLMMGLEMLLVYGLLPFVLVALWRHRTQPILWVIVIPSVAWILIYSLTVPVVGTLVRYRYGALLLLLAMGLAVMIQIVATIWQGRGSESPCAR